jgi:hypothetical protein
MVGLLRVLRRIIGMKQTPLELTVSGSHSSARTAPGIVSVPWCVGGAVDRQTVVSVGIEAVLAGIGEPNDIADRTGPTPDFFVGGETQHNPEGDGVGLNDRQSGDGR